MLSEHSRISNEAQTRVEKDQVEPSGLRQAVAMRSVRYVDELRDLSVLFEPGVNVAVYRRVPHEALLADAQRASATLKSSRVLLSVTPTAEGLHALAERLATWPTLSADVCSCIELLADLTGCGMVGVRLAYLETPMCPRLHVDRVTLRLVTTYLGDGTEYAASEHIDRGLLGHARRGASDDACLLPRAGACVQRAGQGDVVLLKGEAWPGNEGSGAVHRSPTSSALAPRVVLTLDAL